jgi:fucose permease
LFTLLLGVGIEWSITFWAVAYLQDALYLSEAVATMAAGGLFAAIVVGRLIGSRLTRHHDPALLLPAVLIVALVGVGLLLVPNGPVAVVGLIVAGLGIANLFPLALSLGIGAASESSDAASACCTAAVGLALMAFPFAIGRLADTANIRTALAMVVPGLLALALAAREQKVWELFKWVERLVRRVWRTLRSSMLELIEHRAASSPIPAVVGPLRRPGRGRPAQWRRRRCRPGGAAAQGGRIRACG